MEAIHDVVVISAPQGAFAQGADRLHRALRSQVGGRNDDNDGVREAERMVEHQPLHLAVVPAAPVFDDPERGRKNSPAHVQDRPVSFAAVTIHTPARRSSA